MKNLKKNLFKKAGIGLLSLLMIGSPMVFSHGGVEVKATEEPRAFNGPHGQMNYMLMDIGLDGKQKLEIWFSTPSHNDGLTNALLGEMANEFDNTPGMSYLTKGVLCTLMIGKPSAWLYPKAEHVNDVLEIMYHYFVVQKQYNSHIAESLAAGDANIPTLEE